MSSALVVCKTCQAKIAKTAKVCPVCGAKNKSGGVLKWLGWGFAGLIVIGIFADPDSSSSSSRTTQASSNSTAASSAPQAIAQVEAAAEQSLPQTQQQLIDVVLRYREQFRDAENELQQAKLRDERREYLASALGGLSAQQWIGTLKQLDTNSDGDAVVTVQIHRNIELKTWNNSFSDLEDKTMISKSSPLYEQLASMKKGQKVKVTGLFVPSQEDYIKEGSLTITGAMLSPEFIFRFRAIEAL